MKLLEFLTEAFISTFGITRPDERHMRRASMVIGGFLLFAMLGAVSLVGFMLWEIHSGTR